MRTNIATNILKLAFALPEGGIISPKEFLHLGSRAAVDQAFTRLAQEKKMLRVGRGLYTAPVQGHFGIRFPEPSMLLAALSQKTGETIVAHGAMAANQIGLSLQVPVREIHLTSGRTRNLRLNKLVIELRHAPAWQLMLGNSLEGKLLRALASMGSVLTKELFPSQWAWHNWQLWPEVNWKILASASSELPSWLAKTIHEAAYG